MFSCSICRRKTISRNVRCESVGFWNASKIFLSATTSPVLESVARHTTPYAPLPSFAPMSYRRSTFSSISSIGAAAATAAAARLSLARTEN